MSRTRCFVGALALLVGSFASAQTAASAPAPATPTTGFKAEFLKQLDDLETKTVRLAEAIPQEKYSWRPSEGVRSIGEVYAHIAAGNYSFTRNLGVKAPVGLDLRNIEKLTDKGQIVAALKQSFVDMRAGVTALTPDLDRSVKLFGSDSSVRNVLFGVSVHISEHLGQSIAYARSVGVVPPWTADQQAQRAVPKAAEPVKK
ncbi:MAG TPA: DinB family protein [Terriglobales bacterium]|nr:DinB family protein [Terriglobales bacterium]